MNKLLPGYFEKRRLHAVVLLLFLISCLLIGSCTSSFDTFQTHKVTGKILSVNATAHSVTFLVDKDGKQESYTMSGLSDQQIHDLLLHEGEIYTLIVPKDSVMSTSSISSPSSVSISTPSPTADRSKPYIAVTVIATAGATVTIDTNGSSVSSSSSVYHNQGLRFIGKVQSISSDTLVVTMPNGDTLPAKMTPWTNQQRLFDAIVAGQSIQVHLAVNDDGDLVAIDLRRISDNDHPGFVRSNTVTFHGVTTSAVGSDNTIRFTVGKLTYSFTATDNPELDDFSSLQSIGNNQPIELATFFDTQKTVVLMIARMF